MAMATLEIRSGRAPFIAIGHLRIPITWDEVKDKPIYDY